MINANDFNNFVWIWIGIAIIIFPILLFVTAPYGRHSKTNWGPMINNRIGWILMELPSLLIILYFIIGSRTTNIVALLAASLWVIHYTHRSIIFPFRINTRNKKMPILIMLFAIIFNSVNGFINGYWLGTFADYSASWFLDIRFIVGILLFVSGFIINQFHDKILIGLRKNNIKGYQIPYGGLFKYISCPNFFGEIIEWAGFAVLTWSLPALAFFVWTFVNLVPRAIDHHKWYKKQFIDYPATRKAIIPKLL